MQSMSLALCPASQAGGAAGSRQALGEGSGQALCRRLQPGACTPLPRAPERRAPARIPLEPGTRTEFPPSLDYEPPRA